MELAIGGPIIHLLGVSRLIVYDLIRSVYFEVISKRILRVIVWLTDKPWDFEQYNFTSDILNYPASSSE